ncbi:MAG TPA: PAS domain-containing protein [Phycisphaerae bacterium]|nr:PAS domain-containing protein [Phycisphaerae bacterium]HRW55980.1 PAS domain-containing protein [Phycisphaerae bacterium]
MSRELTLTGRERTFGEDEIIVSKTDVKGRITYANEVFIRVAGYTEDELLGKPHNIIRHPDMPRCVFKLLWDTIEAGREIFAYVINRCKNGDHYWVFAHVTPTYNDDGQIIGYHSNRRVPDRSVLSTIKGLYTTLLNEEKKHRNPKDQMAASFPVVLDFLKSKGMTYEELIFSLKQGANERRGSLEPVGA